MKSITIRSARVRIHFGRYDRDLHPLYIFTLSLVCLIYRIVAPNTTNTQLFFSPDLYHVYSDGRRPY